MATYYVKNGGNNGLSGLDDTNAWATIAYVNSRSFSPDDIISFKCGSTWTETIDLGLQAIASGTSGHPITYNSYSTGAKPKIMTVGRFTCYLDNDSYITFDGICFDGTNYIGSGGGGDCIKMTGASTNNRVINCTLQNSYASGVLAVALSDYNYFGYCEVVDIGDPDNGYGNHAFYISTGHNIFEYNDCHRCTHMGINLVAEDNTPSAIAKVHNNIVRYNYTHHNDGGGLVLAGGDDNAFYYNISVNNAEWGFMSWRSNRTLFYNNTIAFISGQTIGYYLVSATTNAIIKNNIIYQANNYNYGTGNTFSNNLTSDPYFLNAGGSYLLDTDFRIQSTSSARNYGVAVGLSEDYEGNAISGLPDAGAFEYTVAEPSNIYYISTTGVDSLERNGSVGQEWLTLQYACTRVTTAGGIIHVNAGDYILSSQVLIPVNINIEGVGDTSRFISALADDTEDGGVIFFSGGSNTLQNISYIKLDGNNLAGYRGIGVYARSNVKIHHCTIVNFYTEGVRFYGSSTNNEFYNNTLTNCGRNPDHKPNLYIGNQTNFLCYNNTITQTARGTNYNGNCISGYEASYGTKIYNNVITAAPYLSDYVWKFAVELWLQSGLEMYENTIKGEIDMGKDVSYGTYDYGIYFHDNTVGWDSPIAYSTNGLQLEQTAQGVTIAYNTFKNLDQPIHFCQYNYADDYVEDVWIYANLIYNCGLSSTNSYGWGIRFESGGGNYPPRYYDNINIWNNTIVAYSSYPASWGIELPTHALETNTMNIDIKNNIIVGFKNYCIYGTTRDSGHPTMINDLTIAKNVVYGNGGSNNVYFNFTPGTPYTNDGGIKSDPLFVSSPTDLHLSSISSPAYGVGSYVGLVTDYDGAAWGNPPSIGAYEYLTPIGPPTVITTAASDITSTTATGGGNVTNNGGSTVTDRGIVWDKYSNPDLTDYGGAIAHVHTGSGTGSFISYMTGLTPGLLYHVRAFAVNSSGTSYGADLTFTALAAGVAPTVTTDAITGITTITATGGGNVTSIGSAPVTARGVCWSTSPTPIATGNHTTDGTGPGIFTSTLTGLTPSTYYYVRAYATNSVDTSYGVQTSFTTSAVVLATVTTTVITFINPTTATGGGNVTSAGGGTVSSRGICWSTSTTPTTANSHTTETGGTGVFISTLTGLTASTFYYVRAYAVNQAGTAYGTQVTFTTTTSITLPVVTTTVITDNDTPTATGGGNVTSTGGATVTVRGVCWSTSTNPTVALSTKTSNGTGLGVFTSILTELENGLLYYVRAYATNSVGTAYGNLVTFTSFDVSLIISISAANLCNFYILEYEVPGYVELTDGTTTIRKGVRDGKFVIDIALTVTGFEGIEDIDWENIKTVE